MRTWLAVAALVLAALPAHAQSPAVSPASPNPLLTEWKTPFGLPPFDQIKPEHYLPAFQTAISRHSAEVDAIAKNHRPASFANTIEALENSGALLEKVDLVFGNLSSSKTSEAMQAIDTEVSPMLAAHADDIRLNGALFQRVKAVWESRAKLKLAPDQAKLLENTWKDFVRGGALLSKEQKERFRAINAELARLTVKFGDNVLRATNAYRLVIDVPADLAGLPEPVVTAAAADAKQAGLEGKWVFTLHQMPGDRSFLQFADNRELRRQFFEA